MEHLRMSAKSSAAEMFKVCAGCASVLPHTIRDMKATHSADELVRTMVIWYSLVLKLRSDMAI